MKKKLQLIFAALTFAMAGTALATTGGPDTYGYTFKDSNEPNGPSYNWIEIATPEGGTGTHRTVVACDDCHEDSIALGFNFPFYGTNFNHITISSNGTIYFEDVYLGLSNSCIPGTPGYTMTQYNFIAHMWNDLDAGSQGGIYTKAFPNYFVIEYYNIVPCCGVGDGDTWQIILFKNGNILMQYKELSNVGIQGGFTIGIQNNPTTGLQYVCDATGTAPASGRSILFAHPSFSCASVSQNILPATTGFCAGSSVNLTSGATAIAQMWSTMQTASSINVNTMGSYTIAALDSNGCTLRDTISVTENALPVVSLGADASVCGSIMLDATNAGSTYTWSTGAATQTINVTSTGTYSVNVEDVNGCEDADTVMITVNPLPAVALGTDITQCEGTATLDAGNAGSTFLWSNAETTQAITVSASGMYSVMVTDAATSCVGKDTINVTINSNPTVSLALVMDTVCLNDGPITLGGGTPTGGTFSGTGITAGVFDPSVAGVGSHTVTYTYVDGNSCSDSDVQVLVVDVCAGISASSFDNIRIYPNPANGTLFIEMNAAVATSVEVINAMGQVVMNEQSATGTIKLNMEGNQNGMYFVKITNGTSTRLEKIILQ